MYFKNAEKLIRLDFRFKKHIIDEVDSHFKQYLDEKPVSILVRDFNPEYDYPNCDNNHVNSCTPKRKTITKRYTTIIKNAILAIAF